MPDLRANRAKWNDPESWTAAGDEWSLSWGNTDQLWWGTLRPRIRAYVPTGTILEIAPGFGRWTQYLKDLCSTLVVTDLSELALRECERRLGPNEKVSYALTDGKTLNMVADGSVDFAFSFDSLVHVEQDVIGAYIRELASKLAPHGVAFIHHSNMATLHRSDAIAAKVPKRLRGPLTRRGLIVNNSWRGPTVSADGVAHLCEQEGLACISQELVNWGHGLYLIDAISVFTPATSRFARPLRRYDNRGFMREAHGLAKIATLYGPSEP